MDNDINSSLQNYITKDFNSPDLNFSIMSCNSFSTILNEKNSLIEELKNYVKSLRKKFEDDLKLLNSQNDSLYLKYKESEEKIKTLISNNSFEVIDYYEQQIKKITEDYNHSLNMIKNNVSQIEHKFKNVHVVGLNNNFSSFVNGILKENERANDEIANLKKIDRMNHVYKGLFDKFAIQNVNKEIILRNYEKFTKNQNDIVNKIESENKILKEKIAVLEERLKFTENSDSEYKFLFENTRLKTLISTKLEIDTFTSLNDVQTANHQNKDDYYNNIFNYDESLTFTKIISSSKIILTDRVYKLVDVNNDILKKLDECKNKSSICLLQNVKISVKKLITNSNLLLDTLKSEIVNLNSQAQVSNKIDHILRKIIKEIFLQYNNYKNTPSLTQSKFDDSMNKIYKLIVTNNITLNK